MGQQQLLLIVLGILIVGIAIAVGLTLVQSNSADQNRESLTNYLVHIGALAQHYYHTPISMGGGGRSFVGFKIADEDAENESGKYVISVGPSATGVTITATGNEIGIDETNFTTVSMAVAADSMGVDKTPGYN